MRNKKSLLGIATALAGASFTEDRPFRYQFGFCEGKDQNPKKKAKRKAARKARRKNRK